MAKNPLLKVEFYIYDINNNVYSGYDYEEIRVKRSYDKIKKRIKQVRKYQNGITVFITGIKEVLE